MRCKPQRLFGGSDNVVILSNAAPIARTVSVACVGLSGRLQLGGGSVRFPPTDVGSTAVRARTIRNDGNAPVTITAVASSDPQFAVAVPGGLPAVLAVGASMAIEVAFTPTRGREWFERLLITSDSKAPFDGFLQGSGRTGHADLFPENPDLGGAPLGTTTELVADLGNHGDDVITLQSIEVSDPSQFTVPDLRGLQLGPGSGFPVSFAATPHSVGLHEADVAFVFDHGPPVLARLRVVGVIGVLSVATWDAAPSDGALSFGEASIDRRVSGLISITNTGDTTMHVASCAIVGDPSFEVVAACDIRLEPGTSADVELAWTPAALGVHVATLQLMSDAAVPMLEVPLSGTGVEGSTSCAASGGHGGGLVWLALAGLAIRRRRRRAGSLVGRALVGGVLIGCALVGCSAAPEPGLAARTSIINVERVGTGTGMVNSLLREIACGDFCTASFEDLAHLAATPDSGSVFVGWSGPCVGVGPCVVAPSADEVRVTARFERVHQLTIDVDAPSTASNAPVAAHVTLNGERCELPCARQVREGPMTLDVFTLSTFTGWSGGCSPEAAPCTLSITGDVALVVHVAMPGEQWTAVERDFVPSAATAIGDEPVAAGIQDGELRIARYASTGERTWLSSFAVGGNPLIVGLAAGGGAVHALVATRDDETSALTLYKLDGDGALLWTVVIADAGTVAQFHEPPLRVSNDALAMGPDGGAVVIGGERFSAFVRAFAPDGTLRWRTSLPTPFGAMNVSVDRDGIITTVSTEGSFHRGRVERFAPDGSRLVSYMLPLLVDEGSFYEFFYAFEVVGDELVCASQTNSGGPRKLRGLDVATGTTTRWIEFADLDFGQIALRADGLGNYFVLGDTAVSKVSHRNFAWRREPSHDVSPAGAPDAQIITDVAADAQGRALAVGAWRHRCAPGDACQDGAHTVGFVRRFAP